MKVWSRRLSVVLVVAFVASLSSCAAGDNGRDADGDRPDTTAAGDRSDAARPAQPTRLILARIQTSDSAREALPAVVDGMLAQVFDSIPEMTYVPLSEQERVSRSMGLSGDSAVSIAGIVDSLDADGLISIKVARFGSVIGIDFGVFDPNSGEAWFHDRAFSFIRFRTKDETKLMGPALYEALQREIGRMLKIPDFENLVISAQPLIIGNVEIGRDPGLGKISEERVAISKDGVRALGDFMRAKYREFIVFDFESRTRAYETVGLEMVEDHEAVSPLELDAMFKLDIPYFLTTGIYPAPDDSVEIRAQFHRVTSRSSDTVVDSEARRYARADLETTELLKNTITAVLELADKVMGRQAGRLRSEYAASIGEGN